MTFPWPPARRLHGSQELAAMSSELANTHFGSRLPQMRCPTVPIGSSSNEPGERPKPDERLRHGPGRPGRGCRRHPRRARPRHDPTRSRAPTASAPTRSPARPSARPSSAIPSDPASADPARVPPVFAQTTSGGPHIGRRCSPLTGLGRAVCGPGSGIRDGGRLAVGAEPGGEVGLEGLDDPASDLAHLHAGDLIQPVSSRCGWIRPRSRPSAGAASSSERAR